jgi:3-oxoacyl-(acyl-carrier-protein) synthase
MGTDDFSWLLDASTQSTSAAAKPFAHHPSELGELLSEKFSATPSVRTIHTACASSAQAIGEAYDLIASGQSKVILAGGADSMIEPIQLAGLSLLGALSPSKGNEAPSYGPFDQDRDGFVFGEGAAILVFEEWDHAISRGAPIFCELLGYGITQSAYRITDLNEDGSGPRDAVLAASVDANVPLAEISYVNAHGTGTKANDYVESKIIAELCPQSYVSTTKNLTGHMIAAAGAQEAILTVLALRNQILPPTINVKKQDLECKVRLTSARCAPHAMTYAMSNSIGFGGTNVSLIFGRHRHES